MYRRSDRRRVRKVADLPSRSGRMPSGQAFWPGMLTAGRWAPCVLLDEAGCGESARCLSCGARVVCPASRPVLRRLGDPGPALPAAGYGGLAGGGQCAGAYPVAAGPVTAGEQHTVNGPARPCRAGAGRRGCGHLVAGPHQPARPDHRPVQQSCRSARQPERRCPHRQHLRHGAHCKNSAADRNAILFLLGAFVRIHSPWPAGAPDGPQHPTVAVDENLPWMRVRAPDIQAAMGTLGHLPRSREEPAISLSRVDLRSVALRDSRLNGARFRYANLARSVLGGVWLERADLTAADLRLANLEHAHLAWANLSRASLQGREPAPRRPAPCQPSRCRPGWRPADRRAGRPGHQLARGLRPRPTQPAWHHRKRDLTGSADVFQA